MWVFRRKDLYWKDEDEGAVMDKVLLGLVDMEQYDVECERFAVLEREIRGQEDMDGVCDVLQAAGAVRYPRVEDCPEVVGLGLLGVEGGG